MIILFFIIDFKINLSKVKSATDKAELGFMAQSTHKIGFGCTS